jgi:hypothetical protein
MSKKHDSKKREKEREKKKKIKERGSQSRKEFISIIHHTCTS